MTSTKKEDEEKFALIFRAIHDLPRLKDQEKFEKLVYTLINAIKMKIKSDGMNPEMNDPMPYNFREQSEPNIGDPYGKLPLHYLKAQAAGGDSNEKQMKHTEDMNDKKSLITSHLNQTYGPVPPNTIATQFNFYCPDNSLSSYYSMDQNRMIISYPGDLLHSLKGLSSQAPSSDPMQQYLHHAPSLHYVQMNNMDSLLGSPSSHQQVDTRFSSMTDSSSGMRSRCYHPYNYPRIDPSSHPMNLNDSQSSSSQSITNASVPTTKSTQQFNIENLGPDAAPRERQTSTIGNIPDSQHQQS
ncbi:unnamed protein product [Rotaria magnacalcarata]|uniref:Uncharacterized protein n=1 Tax=Rotaria magnacalcarata TaxID=392030 RepID=A0A816Z2N7_9BILA|nr:unnamed protein product [Rotaria magnacalcarata]